MTLDEYSKIIKEIEENINNEELVRDKLTTLKDDYNEMSTKLDTISSDLESEKNESKELREYNKKLYKRASKFEEQILDDKKEGEIKGGENNDKNNGGSGSDTYVPKKFEDLLTKN